MSKRRRVKNLSKLAALVMAFSMLFSSMLVYADTSDSNNDGNDPIITEPTTAQADPAQSDPAQTDPAQQDPAQQDPAQADPAQTDPAQTGDGQTDPAQGDGIQTGDGQTDGTQLGDGTTGDLPNNQDGADTGNNQEQVSTTLDVKIENVTVKAIEGELSATSRDDGVTEYNQPIQITFDVIVSDAKDLNNCDIKANILYGEYGRNIVANPEDTLKPESIDDKKADLKKVTFTYKSPASMTTQKFLDSISVEATENVEVDGNNVTRTGKATYELKKVLTYIDEAPSADSFDVAINNGADWIQNEDNQWYSKSVHEDRDLFIEFKGWDFSEYKNVKLVEVDAQTGKETKITDLSPQPEVNYFWFIKYYTFDYKFQLDASDADETIHNYKLQYEYYHWWERKYKEASSAIYHTYIDNKAPEYDIQYSFDGDKTHAPYYNNNVNVAVTLTDKNLNDPSLKLLAKYNSENTQPIVFTKDEKGVYTGTVTAKADDEYKLVGDDDKIVISDQAGNSTEIPEQEMFIVDKTKPQVKVKFDNHDVKNDKYYKADRTATISVHDKNIDAADVDMSKVTVKSQEGTATVNNMSGGGSDYSATILFDKDGIYQIGDIKFVDKAGNECEIVDSDSDYNAEFVIDKTIPTIAVEFDNNSKLNDIYFKDARTASINIHERNFASNLVTVDKNSSEKSSLPKITAFTDSDNHHVAKLGFDADGRYGFTLLCEDLAGNVSEKFVSEDFVIDRTAPELEITGVENMSANNGAVIPVIKSKDANITQACTVITLTGSNNGTINPSITSEGVAENISYTIGDLAHEKHNDDLYTLTVKLTDLAGNEVEKKIQYSVNRFGSIFVLSDGTKAMVNKHYVANPENVVITEINVDSLNYKEVSVAYDGDVKELKEGRGYTTSDLTNEKGWHSISYTIDKSNYTRDGLYSFNIYSEDRAKNRQSSQAKDAEIEFIVDLNAPSILVSGLESDGVYQEANHDFTINATDEVGVTEMKVFVDAKEFASFSGKELTENGGTETITIPAKDDYQQIEIICSDLAGHETKLAYNNVLVSEQAEVLMEDGEIQKVAIDDEDKPLGITVESNTWLWILIVALVIAAGAATIVIAKKKSKVQ